MELQPQPAYLAPAIGRPTAAAPVLEEQSYKPPVAMDLQVVVKDDAPANGAPAADLGLAPGPFASTKIIASDGSATDLEAAKPEKSAEAAPEKKKEASGSSGSMTDFYVIAFGYLFFTITDSSLRMVVLLKLNEAKYDALAIAIMFSMYELTGVFTNLLGGIAGSKVGLRWLLIWGLICQILGIALLYPVPRRLGSVEEGGFGRVGVIAYVTFCQAWSGIAKDLVKLSGKSVTKLVKKDDSKNGLFKLVAYITGCKNAVKGLGYFWGSLLLAYATFDGALGVLLGMNVLILPLAVFFVSNNLGRSKKKIVLREVFNKGSNVNYLSLARFFLFGARDLWFEVPLPIFLRNELYWPFALTGTFLAVWIMIYGGVQSWTPQLVLKPLGQLPMRRGRQLIPWTAILTLVTLGISLSFRFVKPPDFTGTAVAAIVGLSFFCVFFAVNSSIHSFLILAYCNKDKAAMNIGFYYMANAFGRLIGTLLSGVLYQYGAIVDSSGYTHRLESCLWASLGFAFLSTLVNFRLGPLPEGADAEGGHE
eukprot:tig00000615_g2563.t1